MNAVYQSFLAGFPTLMLHFSVTLIIFATGVFIYIKITPYDDFKLIRDQNTAVAISLAGSVIGLSIPLAFTMANSIIIWEIVIWGFISILIQLLAYRISDMLLKDLPNRISSGEIGAAIVLVSIKLACAIINAAAIGG